MNDGTRQTVEDTGPEEEALFPSLDRFNAFSDGVFAIAITLLVLELPVPPENVAVGPALQASWRDFLAYLISFAFIGGIWLTHATLTKVMKRGDSVSYSTNLILLLFVAVIPFSTRLMATHLGAESVALAVAIYGVNVLLASLTLSLMMFYVAREPALVVGGIADEGIKSMYRRRWVIIGVNVFALAMAFVAPLVAVGLYLLTTVMVLALPLFGLVRRRRLRA